MSSNLDQEEVLREVLSFNLAEPSNTSSTQHNEQPKPIAPPSASIFGSVSSTSRPNQVQQCQNKQPPQRNEQPIAPLSAIIAGSVSSTSRPIQVQQCQNNQPPQHNEQPIC